MTQCFSPFTQCVNTTHGAARRQVIKSANAMKQRRGGIYCVAVGTCNNRQFTEAGVFRYMSFPSEGNQESERVRRQWTLFVKKHRPDFQPSSPSHLCSAHFEQSAFTAIEHLCWHLNETKAQTWSCPHSRCCWSSAVTWIEFRESAQLDREKRQVRLRVWFWFCL